MPETDIAIIATYADSHLPILADCLEAGVHVLCEKPIAGNMADGIEFYNMVKASSSKVLVAHILRHNRSYQTIAGMIHDGSIGQMKLIRMVQNHHAMDWERYKRLMEDCPPVVDCGVHYLDIMQWFSRSRICRVGGLSTQIDRDAPCDNFGVINVQLDNGCVGYYEAAWSPNSAAQNLKEFIGEKGRITLTLQENRVENREEGDLITLYTSADRQYKTINVPCKYKDMYRQLQALIEIIESGASPIPTLEEAVSAHYIAMMAQRAIQQQATLSCLPFEEWLAAGPTARVPGFSSA